MSTQIEHDPKLDNLIEQGEQIYQERLRSMLEPNQLGRFVAIEPETEQYFLGNTGTEALVEAQEKMPEGRFYLIRIGNQTADRISGYGSRIR